MTMQHDPVNHPAHYKGNGLEAIEVIEDWQLGFHLGNAVKYILRAGKKGDRKQDLEKALWYVRRAKGRKQSGVVGSIDADEIARAFELRPFEAAAVASILKANWVGRDNNLIEAQRLLQRAIEQEDRAP